MQSHLAKLSAQLKYESSRNFDGQVQKVEKRLKSREKRLKEVEGKEKVSLKIASTYIQM